MPFFTISVPFEARLFFGVLNWVACAVLVIIRVDSQRKQKIKQPQLSATGLSCMIFALTFCSGVVIHEIKWHLNDKRWCDLSMRVIAASYALHRVLLYTFIILRLETVNQLNFVSPRVIDACKAVIGVTGIFMVFASIVFSKGVRDQDFNCWFECNEGILFTIAFIDISICVFGTWMCIRPLRQSVRDLENLTLRFMIRKIKIWTIVCLIATLLAMLTVGVIDGAAGVMGFDCSITSFSLVRIMAPVSIKGLSKSLNTSTQDTTVQVEQRTRVAQENHLNADIPLVHNID